jgi:hypothetical protein
MHDVAHSPRPTFRNAFQSHNLPTSASTTTRHRHNHSMTLSRSHNGYSRALSRSPERRNPNPNGNLSLDRHHNVDHDTDHRDPDSDIDHTHPLTSPPLLMAPPTTLLGDLRHRAALLLHRASQRTERLAKIAKLALFLLKMATLQQVCSPYSVGRIVGACLFAAASVELVVPWLSGQEVSSPRQPAMGVSPKGAADTTFAEDAGVSGTQEGDHASTAEGRSRIPPARTSGRDEVGAWRRGARGWDWRLSLLLLASHYLILGVSSRYGALCAVPDGEKWLPRR